MDQEPLFAEDRRLKIVEYVESRGRATVTELVDRFAVSSATIRNDLRDLDRASLIIRTHGGAIIKSQTGFELKSVQKLGQNSEAKRRIARAALELVDDGDTILMDSGTTTLELAKQLRDRHDLSVVTNSLAVALALEDIPTIQVIVVGGVLRKGFQCTVGLAGRSLLDGLVVDKAFMGLNGLSVEMGASTPDVNHAEIKKAMIRIAKRVILLCDGSKFSRDSFARFAGLEEIDVVVTESIDDDIRARFEENDIQVITAP